MMRRTTLRDVAKLAGVGKVTVSYVLNGQSRVARISEETEKRVMAAARELEYRPNGLARMLASRRTETIALVFQYADLFSAGSGFINEVMRGVCAATVDQGYDLMLHTKAVANPHKEADVLSDGRVDGALALRDEDDPTLIALLDRGFPTVQFFTRCDHPNAAWVDADNFSGARMAVRHLLELGHRRISMVMGPAHSVAANDRFQGFRDALESAGVEVKEDANLRCGSPLEVADILPDFLRKERPTAIFCWSDDTAVATIEVARSVGLSVPRELSVIGFDSLEICNRSTPALTSVSQPIFDMAAEATRLLAAILRGDSPARRQILYPLTLDVRGSTAPAILAHNEVIQ